MSLLFPLEISDTFLFDTLVFVQLGLIKYLFAETYSDFKVLDRKIFYCDTYPIFCLYK